MEVIYWAVYCVLDGINDSFFYHARNPNIRTNINEHVFKLFTRVLVAYLIAGVSLYTLVIFMLLEPFIHNNTYYNFRHYLNNSVYSYGLTNQSKTSTAKLTKFLTPTVRILLAAIGLGMFLSSCSRYELFYYDCKQENCIYYFINKKDSTITKVDSIGAYDYGCKKIRR